MQVTNLHCYQSVIHHHFFGEKVCTDSSLVLVAELLVDKLVHERRFTDTRVTKDDDLQQYLLSGCHSVRMKSKNPGD